MSASAASLLTRLDELKKWQEEQQKRLMLQNRRRPDNADSYYDTIQGLSAFDSTRNNSGTLENCVDSRSVSHVEQLKNELYESPQEKKSQKKPYLRRGSGLSKFGMNPGDQKRPFTRQISRKTNKKIVCDKVSNNEKRRNEIKTDNIVTALDIPDCNIKARWYAVNVDEIPQKPLESHTSNLSQNVELQNEVGLIAQINKLALEKLQKSTESDSESSQSNNKLDPIVADVLVHKENSYNPQNPRCEFSSMPSEQTLYEKALEKELLIFEALEQKVMHTSFSSTNSSVVRLLSSTPNKNKSKEVSNSENCREQEEDEISAINLGEHISNNKKTVHFEPSDQNAIMQLLHSLQIRNGNSNFEFINTENNILNLCPPKEVVRTSSNSSINSDDFEEETVTNIDFKDTEHWSDTNANNSGNSSLVESLPSTVSIESSAATCTLQTTEKGTNFPEESNHRADLEEHFLATKTEQLEKEQRNCKMEIKKLEKMKTEFEKEQREFKKEKKAFEKYVLDEKIKVEFYLEDEKKKFAKEKMIFERYVKDVNNKTTRKEREEISVLKSELANVKEAAKLKETRNAMSQARLRNQIKALEKENANLKEEVEKLLKQNAKLQTVQKMNNRKVTDTKMLHEINKSLSKLAKDVKVTEQLSKFVKSGEKQSNRSHNDDSDSEKLDVNKKRKSSCDESTGSRENECSKTKSSSPVLDNSLCDYSKSHSRAYSDYIQEVSANKNDSLCDYSKSHSRAYSDYMQEVSVNKNDYQEKTKPLSSSEYKESNSNSINCDENLKSLTNSSLIRNYEKMFGVGDTQQNIAESNQKTRTETVVTDGTSEISYSNGNKKVVSPDGNFIVMTYFNGDIKETRLLEGVVRYYYSENQSWHTTYADGSELLEFPNGQTEKKLKDGTSEITFPNRVIKRINSDGSEDISYPDGSKVSIDSHGQKILLLPNGQKEIHNEDHKRREYPDGTVKILYPDGIQETRYSNGRIRIKDNNGKLLLDSFDENT